MGILISVIALPVQAIAERRKKKKAEKQVALNSTATADTSPSTVSQSQPQSRRPDTELQEPAFESPPEALPEQQQRRVEELNSILGDARVGYPAPAAATTTSVPTPAAAAGGGTSSKAVDTPAATDDKMASDEDYMAFLDKANQDPSLGYSAMGQKTGGKVQLKTMDEGAVVPEELRMATEREEWIYTSDADEPFVAVSLALKGEKLPDEEEFARMIHHPDPASADIEILDPVKWDNKGQYKEVVDATRKACMGGDVRVYRVALGGTRVEYWVVGVEGATKGKQKKLVGVKALAVES